jgi:hypothetical protein
MTKIAGSGSGSISQTQRHGSADPDQNVMNPEHWEQGFRADFSFSLKFLNCLLLTKVWFQNFFIYVFFQTQRSLSLFRLITKRSKISVVCFAVKEGQGFLVFLFLMERVLICLYSYCHTCNFGNSTWFPIVLHLAQYYQRGRVLPLFTSSFFEAFFKKGSHQVLYRMLLPFILH